MLALLGLSSSVLLIAALTTAAASQPPPRCSDAATRGNAVMSVGRGYHDAPLYLRFCGPARAVVSMNGRSYSFRGGHCLRAGTPGATAGGLQEEGFVIGLITNTPAAPGRGISIQWQRRATRRVHFDDSEVEVAGTRVAASGTVTVRSGRQGGTFTLHGRNASGPTGVSLSGTWTCI
jgi:hypothetical protein